MRFGMLDSTAGVTRVTCEKPRHVLRIGEWGRTQQATAEKIEHPFAVLGDDFGDRAGPEFALVGGQAMVLVPHWAIAIVAANQRELAVVRDQHLVVALPVFGDLRGVCDREHIASRRFALDHAARG